MAKGTRAVGGGPPKGDSATRFYVPAVLFLLAAVGWWWSARMAAEMSGSSMRAAPGTGMTMGAGPDGHAPMEMPDRGTDTPPAPAARGVSGLGGFLVAWLAMMTAMMFPAIAPVVKLYGRAAAAGRVAPLPFFVGGYLLVWTSLGLPVYWAWRELMLPVAEGRDWAGRLAGGVLIGAALWQLSPLKSICLRHCRSPLSFFMRFGPALARPVGALWMGGRHGLFCVGCCWALMAVLVALGTMNLAWMLGLALLILLEKNAPAGERIAQGAALVFVGIGLLLVLRPQTITMLT